MSCPEIEGTRQRMDSCRVHQLPTGIEGKTINGGMKEFNNPAFAAAEKIIVIPIAANRINLLISPTGGSVFNLPRATCHAFLNISHDHLPDFSSKQPYRPGGRTSERSDDGRQKINGKSCQKGPKQKFCSWLVWDGYGVGQNVRRPFQSK